METHFQKYENLELACEVSPVQLTPSSGDILTCSRACKEHRDCTSFVYTENSSSVPSHVKPGKCTFCPVHNITGLRYPPIASSQTETWLGFLGRMFEPPSHTFLPIKGALSIGKLMVVKGRVPVPAPARFYVDIFQNDQANVVIRIAPRLKFLEHENQLRISSFVVGDKWDVRIIPEFPFAEGKDYEISLLSTKHGLAVYIDKVFMHNVYRTLNMVSDIGYLSFKDTHVNMVFY
ncbi:hypothetical protein ElyMa_000396600 [Elysia marginata]|uniref:Galectin n=1 Tax=Elysia marginata TaxID=1093978 RepID=A0AAV4FIJ9_9GAST|nr:hypothetical protein ElyMa_000396600 [Elysia marginata]